MSLLPVRPELTSSPSWLSPSISSTSLLLILFSPMKKKCTYCNVEVVTYVEHESHPLFFIGAFFIFVLFGFLSVIIIPITYLVCKNAVHRCSRCLQKLGEKQCFGLPQNFSDEVGIPKFNLNRSGLSDWVNVQ